jgi:hypothetical protein
MLMSESFPSEGWIISEDSGTVVHLTHIRERVLDSGEIVRASKERETIPPGNMLFPTEEAALSLLAAYLACEKDLLLQRAEQRQGQLDAVNYRLEYLGGQAIGPPEGSPTIGD